MTEITLTKGMVAIVDDGDYAALACFNWSAKKEGATFYAKRDVRLPDGRWTTEYMHRVLLGAGPGVQVDHENGNGLDNRSENLRFATKRENGRNSGKHASASSCHKGVSWHRGRSKWQATIGSGPIGPNGKARNVYIGYYDDAAEAARAYDVAARAAFGIFARVNFPEVAYE